MHAPAYNMLAVIGPTASGKTRLAVRLAARLDGEILSADSRQVYRGLDLGAGKDLDEYTIGGRAIPYHLIDIANLGHEFNVFEYQRCCYQAIEAVWARRRRPILAGGTGLYLEAVLEGYEMAEAPENPALRAELASLSGEALRERLLSLRPDLHNTTDLEDRDRTIRAIEVAMYNRTYKNNHHRPELIPLVLGVRRPRPELRERIQTRLQARLDAGMIEEVEQLLQAGISEERLDLLGLEYRYVVWYLRGEIRNTNDLRQKLASAIYQFARRQESWFRRMERRGMQIHWIDRGDVDTAWEVVQRELALT